MRLWTLHPKYLDARGLVALWREALLAQKVLRGGTRGYRRHPQLERFRARRDPVMSIARYLAAVHQESIARGYRFDRSKVARGPAAPRGEAAPRLPETKGQLMYEWGHLLKKLRRRDVARYRLMRDVRAPEPHPMFRIVAGGVRSWERGYTVGRR
jgi:hypothetical protein